jgi:protein-disulfide isomerase-like protein with CxxC motif
MITITNIRNVSIDGSPVGALVNAFQESGNPAAVQIALETYCDGLISGHAEAVDTMTTDHAAAIAAKDAEIAQLTSDFAALNAYKTAMEERVSTVLQSNDPAQYVALAEDFLTPAQEKARAEKLAHVQALEAEAAALKIELGI